MIMFLSIMRLPYNVSMTVDNWLVKAERNLGAAGIGTARLDALVLLEDVTEINRAQLLAEPSTELSPIQITKLTKLLKRRARHEPLAYVRGYTEFYGHTFVITPAVLEPRPESETMIDLLKKLPGLPTELRLADVGTGSGALGITAKLELSEHLEATVELLEINSKALKVAKTNVDKFTLNIHTVKSDLLTRSTQQNDVLLCNLPYIPDDFHINQAATKEPAIAIFGGLDGLDIYRKLFKQISKLPSKPLYILTEALPNQHQTLQDIAKAHSYQLHSTEDFIQVFKPE